MVLLVVCAVYEEYMFQESGADWNCPSCTRDCDIIYLTLSHDSHLSARMVNCLLRENWWTIPKFLGGKKLLRNVTLQILFFFLFFKFYPSKLTDENFPHMV